MQSIQSLFVTLLTLASLATALPAAASSPAPTPAPTVADILPRGAFINARGATVQEFAAACTVGDDALATCTGAAAAQLLAGRTVMATVQATVQAAQATDAVSLDSLASRILEYLLT